MIPEFLIGFREALEAALIIGIMLGYLKKTGQMQHNNRIYVGIAAGIIASIFTAIAFNALAIRLEGVSEQVFEGATMIVAAIVLTWMIFWMGARKNVVQNIQNSVDRKIAGGLTALAFIAVYREGFETVLFLNALVFAGGSDPLLGAFLGMAAAVVLGFLIYEVGLKLSIKSFFQATSILLILFAAGLLAHGVHEFQEAGFVPVFTEQAWNSKAILDDKSTAGSVLRSLFGYNDDPTRAEVITYLAYLTAVGWLVLRKEKN